MDFLKFKYLYLTFSGILVMLSIISLIVWRLQPSIDFTGGSLLELQFASPPSTEQLATIIQSTLNQTPTIVQTSDNLQLLIKLNEISQDQVNQLQSILQPDFGQTTILRFESIGPTLGGELLRKTLFAILIASGFIMAYVAWTFKNLKYGLSAILAMFHDTIILIGSFAIFGKLFHVEVDSLFVTAVLTTLSFSVHDTVVVYDRIRESQRQYPKHPFIELGNKAVTETLARSLNNSMTIIFMLAALVLMGGATIKWFALALLIGTIAGTYSSPFVAVPILVIWDQIEQRRKQKNKKS